MTSNGRRRPNITSELISDSSIKGSPEASICSTKESTDFSATRLSNPLWKCQRLPQTSDKLRAKVWKSASRASISPASSSGIQSSVSQDMSTAGSTATPVPSSLGRKMMTRLGHITDIFPTGYSNSGKRHHHICRTFFRDSLKSGMSTDGRPMISEPPYSTKTGVTNTRDSQTVC